jgi:twitching motility protein PilT
MTSAKSVGKNVARIDGLLRLVIQQGADELRLLVEREPKMFARGAPKRLSVPATSEETLRILLGDILSAELEAQLNNQGRAVTSYEAAGLGVFRVQFKLAATGGFEVTFLHGAVHGLEGAAEPQAAEAPPPGRDAPPAARHPTQPHGQARSSQHQPDGPQPRAAISHSAPADPPRRTSQAQGEYAEPQHHAAAAHSAPADPRRTAFSHGGPAEPPHAGAATEARSTAFSHGGPADPPHHAAAYGGEADPQPRAAAASHAPASHATADPRRTAFSHGEPTGPQPQAAHSAPAEPQPARAQRGQVIQAARAVNISDPAPPKRATAYATTLPQAEPLPASLTELVREAISLGASDIHLAEGEPISMRVDGKLSLLAQTQPTELPKWLGLDEASHQLLLRNGGVDLALEAPNLGRLRVHVYRTDNGYAAALRLLPRAAPSFNDLNMPVAFDDLVDLPHGLVLVCGAAGAGKSTTLAALAQELLRRRSMVMVTLEDPIEYTLVPSAHSLVRRRQIGRDVRDFPAGLRDALRADPEVLLVGEMRDPESISLALTAAETGHLVLSSLHSGSATAAIERIVDVYPSAHKEQIRTQLADALRAIIVQRLLPRAHGTGRIPAVEVLRVTRAVASLIRDGKTEQLPTVLQSSKREGMLLLERCLADRVQAGEVTLQAANAAANDPDTLLTYLSSAKNKLT